MNNIVISKEEILHTTRELIMEQGWSEVNIRSVAAACGVSVGSIYNYFSSKAELVGALVENVWYEVFHHSPEMEVMQDTCSCLSWIYNRLEYGCRQYPGFFSKHSLRFMQEEKSDGKRLMQHTWQHILDKLSAVLKHDPKIRADAFDENFSAEEFAEILFSLILAALLRQDFDPSAVLKLVRKSLY